MNEQSALEVTLLQAFETAQPASVNWTADDSAWATRVVNSETGADDSSRAKKAKKAAGARADLPTDPPTDAANKSYIAQRAHHAMQRLLPREAAAAKWLALRPKTWPALVLVAAGAFALGLTADSIGSAQRINLLAPPLWAVVLWNAVIYVLLLTQWARGWVQSEPRTGALTGMTGLAGLAQKVVQWGHGAPSRLAVNNLNSGPALQAFAALWTPRIAPLAARRAAMLLHAGSAALALGLIVGMYLRGLVLDYSATWESTFLSAQTAHAGLSFLLSPAAALANIELPSLAAFEALRATHFASHVAPKVAPDGGGASGAPWIHLYAVTLMAFVIVPRLVLAVWSALRLRWLAGHFTLPLDDEYFARLLRQHSGRRAVVTVRPYASTPNAHAAASLRAVLAAALGPDTEVKIAPTLAYGAEDANHSEGRGGLPAGNGLVTDTTLVTDATLAVALFDLSATPEAETQGRFARQLAAAVSTVVVIDEAAFQRRFADAPQRLKQRRDAWRAWASTLATVPLFVNLEQVDLKIAERDFLVAIKTSLGRLPP